MARAQSRRFRSRRAALQALYQWQMTAQAPEQIAVQFDNEKRAGGCDRPYFHTLLHGIPARIETLDDTISPLLDRPVTQLDPVERAILRIGVFELAHCAEVPWRVIINEAVELAKTFGAEQSHKYINGVLDRAARLLRPGETRAD